MDLTTRRRALMAKIIALVKMVVTSATGLVSFATDIVRPVKVTCEFSPVQEGEGDPSPDNVRPISGWTGLDIWHSKKQMAIKPAELARSYGSTVYADYKGATITETGFKATPANNSTGFRYLCGYVKKGVTYTVSISLIGRCFRWSIDILTVGKIDKNQSLNEIRLYASNYRTNFTNPLTFTAPESGYLWLQFHQNINPTTEFEIADIQLELGSTATDYESYQGEALHVSWQSEAGTVYGGTVTLNEDGSADVAAESAEFKISSRTWTVLGTLFRTVATDAQTTMGGRIAPGLMSSVYKPYHRNYQENLTISLYSYNQPTTIYIADNRFSTVQDFVSAMGNEQIVYPLANPITYHFDNIGQLKSFLGTNNIWHDMNGSITAEYWKKQ